MANMMRFWAAVVFVLLLPELARAAVCDDTTATSKITEACDCDGSKACSIATTTACVADTDCPDTETCNPDQCAIGKYCVDNVCQANPKDCCPGGSCDAKVSAGDCMCGTETCTDQYCDGTMCYDVCENLDGSAPNKWTDEISGSTERRGCFCPGATDNHNTGEICPEEGMCNKNSDLWERPTWWDRAHPYEEANPDDRDPATNLVVTRKTYPACNGTCTKPMCEKEHTSEGYICVPKAGCTCEYTTCVCTTSDYSAPGFGAESPAADFHKFQGVNVYSYEDGDRTCNLLNPHGCLNHSIKCMDQGTPDTYPFATVDRSRQMARDGDYGAQLLSTCKWYNESACCSHSYSPLQTISESYVYKSTECSILLQHLDCWECAPQHATKLCYSFVRRICDACTGARYIGDYNFELESTKRDPECYEHFPQNPGLCCEGTGHLKEKGKKFPEEGDPGYGDGLCAEPNKQCVVYKNGVATAETVECTARTFKQTKSGSELCGEALGTDGATSSTYKEGNFDNCLEGKPGDASPAGINFDADGKCTKEITSESGYIYKKCELRKDTRRTESSNCFSAATAVATGGGGAVLALLLAVALVLG